MNPLSLSWRAALGLLFAALPWLNPLTGGPSPSVVPWLVSACCGIALWLLAASGPQRPHLPGLLFWCSLALVGWAALAHLPLQPESVMLAGGLAVILLAADAAGDAEVAHALELALFAAAAISALIGLCQYFGVAPLFSPWMDAAATGDAYANLRQPNQYATLCWIGAAVVLFGSLRLPRWVAAVVLILLAAGSAASVSRTGLLQGLLLTALAALWRGGERRSRLQLCVLAAVAYFLATVVLPLLLEAATEAMPARTLWGRLGGGQACSSRLVLWSNVLHLIAQRPFAGWGWGELDYGHFATLYPGARFCDILDNAHNLPLHLAVELGLPAALLVCSGFLWWVVRQRPWRDPASRRQLAWAVMALILLHSMLEYPLWYGPFQIAFGASAGWLLQQPGRVSRAPGAPGGPRRPAWLGILLLAATGYAAFDYARVSQIYTSPQERIGIWRADTLALVRHSWLFRGQARFAELTLASVTRDNAAWMETLAQRVLHYSPEPRVIERAIESEALLGHTDQAVMDLARYRAAFPQDCKAWEATQQQALPAGRVQP